MLDHVTNMGVAPLVNLIRSGGERDIKGCKILYNCERFESRSHFKSRLSLIVRVNVVLNRTVVDGSATTDDQTQPTFENSVSVMKYFSR